METKAVLTRNKRLIGILVAIALILLLPLVLGAPWTLNDFVIAGILLGGTGLLFELAARFAATNAYKAAAGLALITALLLIWVNLAVGLIGNEGNPANLLYFGVVLIMIIGAGIARFKAKGMSIALLVTALAQAMVPVIAFAIWQPPFSPGVVAVFGFSFFFAILFGGAALLFRHAGNAAPAVRLQEN